MFVSLYIHFIKNASLEEYENGSISVELYQIKAIKSCPAHSLEKKVRLELCKNTYRKSGMIYFPYIKEMVSFYTTFEGVLIIRCIHNNIEEISLASLKTMSVVI